MTREEAEKYAKEMTYRDAINNLMKARSIPYRKATFIKVNELLKELEQKPYKGMTNGQVHDMLYQMLVDLKDGADRYGAEYWWNSPYEPQERSE